jgi:iron(II)-dependent oxidoreductase
MMASVLAEDVRTVDRPKASASATGLLHALVACALLAGEVQAAVPPPVQVLIPGGSYPIGSQAGPRDAQPEHRVRIDSFLVDRFEVTNAHFAEFLNTLSVRPLRDARAGRVRPGDLSGADASRLLEGPEGRESRTLFALDDDQSRIEIRGGRFAAAAGYEHHPVAEATWVGARDYCRWRGARLPTEVEWEAAARGLEGRRFPWGQDGTIAARAVIDRRSGDTLPVGSRPLGATPLSVHDMAGSLQEWTSSLYRPYPYDAKDGREDPDDPGERVTRGGDYVFDTDAAQLTGWYRTGFSRAPGRGHRHIGFRCVADAPADRAAVR